MPRRLPWNKFAAEASEAKLRARDDLREPLLSTLLDLDDSGFRALFSGSPIKRIGRDRFLRNVLIAAGNSGDASLIPPCRKLLDDPAPLVRGAAVWALSRLMADEPFRELADRHATEPDDVVAFEWRQATMQLAAARDGLLSDACATQKSSKALAGRS